MTDQMTTRRKTAALQRIISSYPDVYDDLRLMKALLLDFYPQEKMMRNLILTCAEEQIPQRMVLNHSCSRPEFHKYTKLIVVAHGCSIEKAKEVIFLWIDALDIEKKDILVEYPGHDKCEQLRHIRKKIAAANNISFIPAECTHEGPCSGTCPACDAEIRYLDRELQRKKDRGEEIVLAGIASSDIRRAQINIPEREEWEVTMGQLQPDDPPIADGGLMPCDMGEFNIDDFNEEDDIDDFDYNGDISEKNIDELEFSVRTYNWLKRAGINTVGELLHRTPEDLMQIRNLGSKGVEEIMTKMKELGLEFYGSETEEDIW